MITTLYNVIIIMCTLYFKWKTRCNLKFDSINKKNKKRPSSLLGDFSRQDLTVQEGHTTQKITDLQSRLSEHDTRLEKLERPVQPPVSGQPAQGPVNGPSGNPTSLPPLQEGLPLQSGGAPAGTPAPLNQQQTSSTGNPGLLLYFQYS